jgi:hypothetical protein
LFNPIDTFDGVGDGASAIPDRFYISASGRDFKPLGGHSFGGLLLVLDDYSHRSAIHDTGGGQTLAAQLGGALDLQQLATTLLRVSAEGKSGRAEGRIDTLAKHPDPALNIAVDGENNLRIQSPHTERSRSEFFVLLSYPEF